MREARGLETAGRITCIVLDKTGTITEGKLALTDIVPAAGWEESEILGIAAACERGSEHPVGQAVVSAAIDRGIPLDRASNFQAVPGGGLRASVDSKQVLIGTQRFVSEAGVDTAGLEPIAAELGAQGKTTVLLAVDGAAAGVLAAADRVKPSSGPAISRLKEMGMEIAMITGDNAQTAEAVAREVGIDLVIPEVLPGEKASKVKDLQAQGKLVAMVGDGINDAPALAQADLGIAIGTGTDVAIESSSITLIGGDLKGVVIAIALSRATIRNIKQNLFFAFIYNTLGIPIAAGVLYPALGALLNPMIASAAMAASSLSVVSNALRLRRFRAEGTG